MVNTVLDIWQVETAVYEKVEACRNMLRDAYSQALQNARAKAQKLLRVIDNFSRCWRASA